MSGTPKTLLELLRQQAADHPERIGYWFLSDGEHETPPLTYAELDRRARAIAMLLHEHNAAGERIVLLYPPGFEYIAAFFGCLYAGAIAVPAYPPANKRHIPRIQAIVEDSRARLALTIARTESKIRKWLHDSSDLSALPLLATDALESGLEDAWKAPVAAGRDLAFLQYTSGSTARPKGVMLSHDNLLYNLEMIYTHFGHCSESTGVIWLPPYHDMGLIGGILQPLYGGFPVYLLSPAAFLQRPIRWLQAISKYQATTSGGPNFAYDLCVEKITPEQCESLDLSSWNLAFSGAEQIRHETLTNFCDKFVPYGFRKASFYPCYGLAEATLFVTGGHREHSPVIRSFDGIALEYDRVLDIWDGSEKQRTLVGCGQTLPQQDLMIVNPSFLTRCLPDQVGEIWVSGPGVAQGYWNQPAKTQNIFRAYPLITRERPFLRTGDLGFIRNGELFVTGRLKDLIIIRGRNHYPEDIEWHVEQSYPALREDGSAAFSITVNGEEELVIVAEIERRYQREIVKQGFKRTEPHELPYALGFSPELDHPPDFSEAITSIRQAIARYHDLQVHGILLLKYGSIPRTSSGKIRRHACRDGYLQGSLKALVTWNVDEQLLTESTPYEPPRTETERTLAALCSEVFGAARIGVHDNFFELGGDSLTITQLASRVQEHFEKEIPLSDFFEILTIAELAAVVERQPTTPESERPPIPLCEKNRPLPLSFAQQRVWFFEQLEPGNTAYNLSLNFRLKGPLNIEALSRSIQEILKRHDVLRTRFVERKGQPFQEISASLASPVTVHALQGSSKTENLKTAYQMATELGQKAFDLTQLPLLRIAVAHIAEDDAVLMMTAHHIIFDEWSFSIFMRELAILYEAFSSQKPSPLAPLQIQYADFAQWHNEWLGHGHLEAQLSYWRARLSGRLPVLELPSDHAKPANPTYRGKTQYFTLSRTISRDLNALSKQEGCTMYMTLVSAFLVLLYRYTGQEEIVIGSPFANRRRTELEQIIGFFVNTLALRFDLNGNPTFKELLHRVREVALESYAHQDVPFDHLVEKLQPTRKMEHTPLFQVMFVFQNAPDDTLSLPELDIFPFEVESSTSLFDLTLSMEDTDQGLSGEMIYSSDLFEAPTIIQMIRHFRTLLRTFVEHPEQHIAHTPFLLQAEKRQLVSEWNQPPVEASQPVCVHELFEAQVRRSPQSVAVVWDTQTFLSYEELNRKANQLARYLHSLGVGPEQLVGLCVERSLEMIIGLFGILKSGGAYVPLDSEYPDTRIECMLSDADVSVLLTQEKLAHKFTEYDVNVVCLDRDWHHIAHYPSENPEHESVLEDTACVFYTSGSTGRPKGVVIPHRALLNFTESSIVEYTITSRDHILQYASVSFDAATEEMYPCFVSGAQLVLLQQEERLISVPLLLEKCRNYELTVLDLPTAYWHLMLSEITEEKNAMPESVRLVIIGGERAMPEKLADWRKHIGAFPELVNTYGPTETTVVATRCSFSGETLTPDVLEKAPIGKPLRHVTTYVLDPNLQLVPPGVVGELHIGGEALAQGYLKRPELTAERFIPDPFRALPGKRLYKTGDLARYLPDGNLEFIGRRDHQVKIRGLRVELGDIESVLVSHPAVREAAVLAHEDVSQNKQLVAYVSFQPGQTLTKYELQDFLKERLPSYMVPATFVMLDTLPVTTSGKVDRKALPEPEEHRPQVETDYVMPQNDIQERLAEIWKEVLQIEKVGIYDNFFELGGHSLLTIQVHSHLQHMFGQMVDVVDLFQYPTIHALAEYIAHKQSTDQEEAETPETRQAASRASRRASIRQQRERRKRHRTTD